MTANVNGIVTCVKFSKNGAVVCVTFVDDGLPVNFHVSVDEGVRVARILAEGKPVSAGAVFVAHES